MKRILIIILTLTMILSLSGCIKKIDNNEGVNLYPASKIVERSKLWGYIDDTGEFAIQPKYNNVADFSQLGVAVVERMSSKGIINEKGEELIPLKYREITDLDDGYFLAGDDKTLNVFNHKGDLQFTSDKYVFVGPHREGLFAIATYDDNGELLMGYSDKSGKEVIEPQYMRAYDFNNGKASVKVGENLFHLIDKKGATLKELEYSLVVPSEGEDVYLIKDEDNKYGYLDGDGNIIVEPRFSRGEIFREGGAIVGVGEEGTPLYGVIDNSGEYIIQPEYKNIIILGKGYYGVANERDDNGYKYGISNDKGELVTEFLYYGLGGSKGRIENNLIAVFDGKESYALDLQGKRYDKIPALEGKGAIDINQRITKATVLNRMHYYNTKGNLIWVESNDYQLREGARLIEEQYNGDNGINIYYPVVEGINNKEAEKKINEELYKRFVTDTEEKINENSDEKYDYYNINYSVRKFHDLLTIQLQSESYIEGEDSKKDRGSIYNISLRTGEFFTLKDLFKKDADYTTVLTDNINSQVGMEMMQGAGVYDMKDFQGVKEEQGFIPQLEAIELFFNPTEIKGYNKTFSVFSISQQSLMSILDMESEFWWTYTVNRGF